MKAMCDSPALAAAMICSAAISGGRASSAILAWNFSARSPRKPKRPAFLVGPLSTLLKSRPSASRRAKAVSVMAVMECSGWVK